MKGKHWYPALSERQQLILGLLLVILLAISMLYCLGLASMMLRQAWETAPLPWEAASPAADTVEVPTNPALEAPDNGTSTP